MNTLSTSSNSAQRSHRLAAPYVQCACLLMLASVAVFSKTAIAGTPTYPGPGTGPAAQTGPGAPMQGSDGPTKLFAPPVKTPDPVGVPPGTGPTLPMLPPIPPKVTPPPLPAPAPPLAAPLPPKPIAVAPTPDGGVTPGAGPKPSLVSAPTPAPPPKLDLAPGAPTQLPASVSTPAPAPATAVATDPGKTPTQGTGLNTAEGTYPSAPGQANAGVATPPSSGAVASLLPTTVPASADITELLPGAQKLSESMREAPVLQTQATDKNAKVAVADNKCIPVSFRPDSQRQGLSLVDLTGDGLIISAVPNTHIQAVFNNAGYGQVDLSQAARWCIAQTAVRALVRPISDSGMQQAALLVQTGASLQLMSKDQWLAYQASMTPVVTAMEPVLSTAVEPEVRAKPSKLNKPAKSSKPSNRMVTEIRKPPYL